MPFHFQALAAALAISGALEAKARVSMLYKTASEVPTAARVAETRGLDASSIQWKRLGNVIYSLDQDNDGRLEQSEIVSFAGKQGVDPTKVERQFAALDTDRDGVLEVPEIESAALLAKMPLGKHGPAPPGAPSVHSPKLVEMTQPVDKPMPHSRVSEGKLDAVPLLQAQSIHALSTMFNGTAAKLLPGVQAVEPASSLLVEKHFDDAETAEAAARKLETEMMDLRHSAAAMMRRSAAASEEAAQRAVEKVVQETMANLTKIQENVLAKSMKAASLRAKAEEEARQANNEVAAMMGALKAVDVHKNPR